MNDIIKIPNIDNYHQKHNDNELILTHKYNTYIIIKIPNINNYHQAKNINNELILKIIYVSLDIFLNKDMVYSTINHCIIKNNEEEVISNSKGKWIGILIDIYKSLPASFILQNTTFNIKLTNEYGNKGYIWHPEINMSVQGKDANGTLKEIMKMINKNNYKIDIGIILENEEIINYKN